jgi:hypothetical protein
MKLLSLRDIWHTIIEFFSALLETRSESVSVSSNVLEACMLVRSHLGESFSIKQLIEFIEKVYRRKPLKIKVMRLPNDASGCCLSLADYDLICIQTLGLNNFLQTTAYLHEVGHFLLNHIITFDGVYLHDFERNPYYYLTLALFRNDSENNDSESDADREAESFAYDLIPSIIEDGDISSLASRDLYGE